MGSHRCGDGGERGLLGVPPEAGPGDSALILLAAEVGRLKASARDGPDLSSSREGLRHAERPRGLSPDPSVAAAGLGRAIIQLDQRVGLR
jgi:hypothetical protein